MSKIIKRIAAWYKAKFLDYPLWRVTYKNGEQTRLLHYREAKGLSEVFNGRLWIDYSQVDRF